MLVSLHQLERGQDRQQDGNSEDHPSSMQTETDYHLNQCNQWDDCNSLLSSMRHLSSCWHLLTDAFCHTLNVVISNTIIVFV